ncbi:methylmalonyl-CoA epimerase [Chloroflexota bacterium]
MGIKIDHIGIAVSNLDETLKKYCEVLGLNPQDIEIEVVERQKVRVAMIPVGESKIELLEPTAEDGPIGKYIAGKGEGIHHFAIGVADVESELARLDASGFPLVDKVPRTGVGGSKIGFIHPESTKALLELVEH